MPSQLLLGHQRLGVHISKEEEGKAHHLGGNLAAQQNSDLPFPEASSSVLDKKLNCPALLLQNDSLIMGQTFPIFSCLKPAVISSSFPECASDLELGGMVSTLALRCERLHHFLPFFCNSGK